MQRVFIWGTGYWGEKCFYDILPEVDIIGFVESIVDKKLFHDKRVISGRELAAWNYSYVILANTHENEIIQEFQLDEEKVLIYRQQPRPEGARLFGYQVIDQARKMMPYLSIECDGLMFLYNKTDILMPDSMIFYQSIWSKNEMDFFWQEAPRHNKGIFLDIGANIGTTSIYFRKKLARELNYIAFEPVRENYKIFKMNCILNDCEDVVIENIGISDIEGIRGLSVLEVNYGGSRVTNDVKGEEVCETTRLDSYVKKNNISPQDISYIWIDIEGHEANAIAGAKELLSKTNASLFMEYNAKEYKINGRFDHVLNDLCSIYNSFICYEQYVAGNKQKRCIRELKNLADEVGFKQCNILFMK